MKLQSVFITVIVAFLWVVLYWLNHTIFRFTEITAITSLVFIPSGYKIAVVSVFRLRSWLGLFLGSLTTGFLFLNKFSFEDVVVFSFLSATLPFVALKLSEYIRPLRWDLSNLDVWHISIMGFTYTALNGIFHVCYRYHVLFFRDVHEVQELLAMMVGDILGILIAMLIVARLSKLKAVKNFLYK